MTMTKPPTFRDSFLDLAKDGRIRTVKRIREDLRLSDGSNVGEALRNLQGSLAAEQSEWKLRERKASGSSHTAIWWLEKRK